MEDTIIKIREQIPQSEHIDQIVNFIENSKLGIVRHMKEEE